MALAWTYNSLLAALLAWPVEDEDSEEYVDNVPNLIGLGEIRLVRDLNLSIFDATDESLTIDEGSRFVTKPSGLIATRSLRLAQIISSVAEAPADDDSICTAQVVANVAAALTLNGAAVVSGSVTFSPARHVSVKETTVNDGGLEVIVTGTDKNGFPYSESIFSQARGQTAYSMGLFLTVTSVRAGYGDGTRGVKVGGAVAAGSLVLGETWPLELRSKEFCQAYAPDRRDVGRPRYYNEHSTTQWELVDAADQDYGVISHHVARPQGLTSSSPNASTWLATSVPDALLAACLMEAEHFLKADDRYADYKSKYETELLPAARLELRNSIRLGDRGPFAAAPQPV